MQFIIERLEKLMVRLHYAKKTDLYTLCSKHEPQRYLKTQRRLKIPESVRWMVWRRDGFICAYCLSDRGKVCLDHVVPAARGGTELAGNLVTCCYSCNDRKGIRTAEWFLEQPWLKKKQRKNRKRLSTTQVTQAQSQLMTILQRTSTTTGEKPSPDTTERQRSQSRSKKQFSGSA